MGTPTLIPPPLAAAHLGLNVQTLANWRYRGKGPRYFRVGNAIRYDIADLDAWLGARAVEPQGVAYA